MPLETLSHESRLRLKHKTGKGNGHIGLPGQNVLMSMSHFGVPITQFGLSSKVSKPKLLTSKLFPAHLIFSFGHGDCLQISNAQTKNIHRSHESLPLHSKITYFHDYYRSAELICSLPDSYSAPMQLRALVYYRGEEECNNRLTIKIR